MAGTVVGRVTAIWRHPVKSLQGELLEVSDVGQHGLAGDRVYGVRDGLTGRVMSAKREPRLLQASARYHSGAAVVTLPDGASYAVDDPRLDVAMTEWLQRPVVVVAASMLRPSAAPFMDDCAVHLLTTATLASIRETHPAGDWQPRRFRPNVLVDAAGSGFAEDGWVGAQVGVGSARLQVVDRTIRCPMVSLAQPGLAADPRILATTGEVNDRRLGVYADVVVVGRLTVGDEVELAGRSSS
ncbi:MAG TPA: MOSC N-terminal beta barrel domain-containing protein [Mycobacteriales bacterium]|nr:MOSC N-terminal beta barrel domain-containing protein [Mycobacteriales bacterium]